MQFRQLFVPALVLVQLAACGGGSADVVIGPTPVARIAISPDSPVMMVGTSAKLSATLYDSRGQVIDGRTVTWKSSDATIASVAADGTVTGVKAGPARITATSGGVDGSTGVTINDPPTVAVDRVEVSPGNDTLNEGASKAFTATAYDANNRVVTGRGVTWTIADSRIASVSGGGDVTALRPGTTSVSARIDGKSASATVRVQANYAFELMYGRYAASTTPSVQALDIRDPAAVARPFNTAAGIPQQARPSPDGLRVAFVVVNGTTSSIRVADRDGSNVVTLIDDGAMNDQPAWSPDGSTLAFRRRPAGSGSDIWTMSAVDGSNATNLTANHGPTSQASPSYSPVLADTSVRIAYSHADGGAAQIWTMRDDGTDHQPLTTSPDVFDDQPDWSPDGSQVVFQRSGTAIFGDLYVVGAAGGAGRLLMQLAGPLAGGQFGPTWSPDGQLVAFASRHEGDYYQVYTVWFDGTRLARRTEDDADHDFPRWMMVQ